MFPDLKNIWNIFLDLSNSRSYGFTANPISIQDIMTLFDFYELTKETKTDYFELISALDRKWLEFNSSKESKETKGIKK